MTFSVNQRAMFLWPTDSFSNASEPLLDSTSLPSASAIFTYWAALHTILSAALWLNWPQYAQLASPNLLTPLPTTMLLKSALRTMGAGSGYLTTVLAKAVAGFFRGVGGLEKPVKPISLPMISAAFSAQYHRIRVSQFWLTTLNGRHSFSISLYCKRSTISSTNRIIWVFLKAARFQSRSAAIPSNPV